MRERKGDRETERDRRGGYYTTFMKKNLLKRYTTLPFTNCHGQIYYDIMNLDLTHIIYFTSFGV